MENAKYEEELQSTWKYLCKKLPNVLWQNDWTYLKTYSCMHSRGNITCQETSSLKATMEGCSEGTTATLKNTDCIGNGERGLLDLPDDIIHHIFSYLDLTSREAIRLSRVSKEILAVIEQRQNLVFDYISSQPRTLLHCSDAEYRKRYIEDLNYIHSTLDRYKREGIQLKTFNLKADGSVLGQDHLLDQCIQLIAETCVRNLSLSVYQSVLSQSVFEVESLVELELDHCCLKPKRIAWPNLKRLSIVMCNISAESFEYTTKVCPSLENLEVNLKCSTDYNFCIADHPNLKQLNVTLYHDQSIKVNASNLESIVCSSGELHLINVEYSNIKTLNFSRCIIIYEELKFPKLDHLLVMLWEMLERVDLSSPSLKKLVTMMDKPYYEIYLNVPNVVHFTYKYATSILTKLSFTGNSGGWSSCIEFRDNINVLWVRDLVGFLVALNGSETSITICFGRVRLMFVAKHTSADDIIHAPRIREFSMSVNWSDYASYSATALIDGIFCICQPQIITFLDCCENYEIPKLFYEKLTSESYKDHPYVTDFDMFQSSARFKDWDEFLEALKADDHHKNTVKNISFQLVYNIYSSQMAK